MSYRFPLLQRIVRLVPRELRRGIQLRRGGGLIILLLWVYYSTQIFLLGAEFTKSYATLRSGQKQPLAA